MKPGLVNGKVHYEADDGKTAIWYEGGSWSVGLKGGLGTKNCGFYVSSSATCPYHPGFTWRYVDQYHNWRDADKGFSIWCES